MRAFLPLLLIGCATFDGLPEHEAQQKYAVACVETVEGAQPQRLVRAFDENGRVSVETVTNAAGETVRVRQIAYTEGATLMVMKAHGRATLRKESYDSAGRRIELNQGGNVTRYEYANGRLVREVSLGRESSFEYVLHDGRVIERRELSGGVEVMKRRYSLDDEGNPLTETWRGDTYTRQVDVSRDGLLIERITHVDGKFANRAEYDYDQFGNRIETRSIPAERATSWTRYWYGCWDGLTP